MNTPDMSELLMRKEPLCDELKPYVTPGPVGEMIHHPLAIHIFYDPARCALINYGFKMKLELVEKRMRDGDLTGYVFIHERPYRLQALTRLDASGNIPTHVWWGLIRDVWNDSENIWQNSDDWKELWMHGQEYRHLTMNEDELTTLAMMPEIIPIYRGYDERHDNAAMGMSWTASREKAIWFARRFGAINAKVAEGSIMKRNVLAYLTKRNEDEIVVMPENVIFLRHITL